MYIINKFRRYKVNHLYVANIIIATNKKFDKNGRILSYSPRLITPRILIRQKNGMYYDPVTSSHFSCKVSSYPGNELYVSILGRLDFLYTLSDQMVYSNELTFDELLQLNIDIITKKAKKVTY